MSDEISAAIDEAIREVQPATHAVTLIGDVETHRVIFWHKSETADCCEAVELWGQPVGAAFGTWLEVWLITPSRADRFFPFPLPERPMP